MREKRFRVEVRSADGTTYAPVQSVAAVKPVPYAAVFRSDGGVSADRRSRLPKIQRAIHGIDVTKRWQNPLQRLGERMT